jgi:hypothetical protein
MNDRLGLLVGEFPHQHLLSLSSIGSCVLRLPLRSLFFLSEDHDLRFVDMPVEEKVTAMRELLKRYADAM